MNQSFIKNTNLNTEDKLIIRKQLHFYDYIPLIIILTYNIFTYLLFFFGPWDWPVISHLKLNIFMFFIFISIFMGFKKGIKRKPQIKKIYNKGIMTLFNGIFYLEMIFIPLTLISRTGTLFSLEKILNPGQSYMDAYSMRSSGGWFVYVEYARILFSPLLVAFIPLGIFLWKRLSVIKRMVFVIQLILILLTDIQRGTNKGFIDLIIYLLIISFASYINMNKQQFDEKRFTKKVKKMLKKFLVIGLILIVLFVSFFQLGMKGRSGGLNTHSSNASAVLDTNHWSLIYFNDMNTKIAIGMFYAYLTQGYYALDLSLNKPFMWTYGLGHSLVVMQNADKYIGITTRTYVYRCETENNWKMLQQWHSFYTWVASDVTFFGVIIVMFLLAYFYGRCWNAITCNNDICSLIFFAQITILFFYLPMNNQLGQSFETYFGFLFWMFYWMLTRNFKIQWRV